MLLKLMFPINQSYVGWCLFHMFLRFWDSVPFLRQRGLAPYLVPKKVPNVFPWGPWGPVLAASGAEWTSQESPSVWIRVWSGSLDDPHESHDKTKKRKVIYNRSILMILLLDLRDLCFFLFLCFRFFSFYLILLVQNSCFSSLLVRSPIVFLVRTKSHSS